MNEKQCLFKDFYIYQSYTDSNYICSGRFDHRKNNNISLSNSRLQSHLNQMSIRLMDLYRDIQLFELYQIETTKTRTDIYI